MKVLIACEESQTICKAFRELGHEAYSCDILECSGGHPEWHIKDDVLNHINKSWDLIIAHPPCTYMSKTGARWMFPNRVLNQNRLNKALEAKDFFMKLLNADCKYICVENPFPLKIVGLPKESQTIQPYEFGEPFSKRTLLWLKGLPKLEPTNIQKDYKPYLPSNTGGKKKGQKFSFGISKNAKQSSKTFEGIAIAMAKQWSCYIASQENKKQKEDGIPPTSKEVGILPKII